MIAIVLVVGLCVSCSMPNPMQDTQTQNKQMDDKPFVSGGNIEVQLDSGDYAVTGSRDDHVRISFQGNVGSATEQLASTGNQATLTINNTPHSNFKASIEVPKTSNIVIHLAAGDLDLAAITGNKDIDSAAGDVKIKVDDPNDYASVDASVRVGDLKAGPFGKTGSGLGNRFTWTGRGKYTLRVRLGAGDLTLN